MPIPHSDRQLLKPRVGGVPRVLICEDGALQPDGTVLTLAAYQATWMGRPHKAIKIHGLTLAEALEE